MKEKDRTSAVKNINLQIDRGEFVALVGESGSGKSVTSLSILQLLPVPPAHYAAGKILFSEHDNPVDLLQLQPKELQQVRGNKIGMIFQEPMSSLNPVISCGKQVMEALLLHKSLSKKAAKQKVLEWFDRVELPSPLSLFDRYPHELSGGQKQRVMIAMAMCCDPHLLICDEPTTALDVTVQKSVLELIRKLQRQQNIGVLFITHDLGLVARFADRVAIMYKGEIIEQNTVSAIFNQPFHNYTKALLACRPALHPKGAKLPVVSDFIEGRVAMEHPPIQPVIESTASSAILVEVKNITVQFPVRRNIFGRGRQYHTAVNDVSFVVKKGETLGLVGESGCGKTTIGRTLLGLIAPVSGSITFNGKKITDLGKKELHRFRQDVQLVFQDPFSSLNPRLTIGEAIEEPMKVFNFANPIQRKKEVAALLEKVSMPSSYAKRYPHEFSGGQRQRIVIARALAVDPHFLVCDESVSALDVSVQAQVLNLLNDLKKELQLTMLFISHDLSVVRYMCDTIIVMQHGRIVEHGESEAVYNAPQSGYTKSLLAAIPTA
jgi:peptide/nickel transport system ATP-binding protein